MSVSDQSADDSSFADFLAFLLSPPITSNSTNGVDSSSNIDDAASLDTTSDIDVEAGNVPKHRRQSSVTFNSEIDDCSAELSGDNNDADSDGNDSLSHEELRDLLKPETPYMLSTENCNNDSRDQIAVTTAVILIDFQNDIVKPDGKLHADVSAIMEKNNVLSNVQQVVNTARANGVLVIHSPSIRDKNNSTEISNSINDNYWPPEDTLLKNTWGSEIATPVETSDVILKGRSSECPYEETELSSIITNKNIQSVILLGFYSDVSILETVFYLDDNHSDLTVIVCNDGVASTRERHMGAMRKTLPMFGANVMTCKEARDIIKQGIESPLSRKVSIESENTFASQNGGQINFNVFEFQSCLRGAGVVVSSDVLVSVFTRLEEAKRLNKDIDQSQKKADSFTISEVCQEINAMAGSEKDIPIRAFKSVLNHVPSVLNFLAGLFLFLGLFPIPVAVTRVTGGLLMPLFYLIAGSYTVIKLPITNFKKTLVGDKATMFKRKICDKALEYYESSEGRKTAVEGFQVPFIFVQEMKYIEEVIFSSADKTLHRSDLELLLLRELGTAYNSQLLEYAFSLATRSNPHCINPIEFHSFIASKDMSRYTVKRYLKHAWFVFRGTICSLGYIMALCFFIALSLSVVKWILQQSGITDVQFFAYTWLYVVGTTGFSHMAFKNIENAYDVKVRVKMLLGDCLRYASFYNRNLPIWKKFNEHGVITAATFPALLDSSGVLLAESEVSTLISEIDTDENGIISQDELEQYLDNRKESRMMVILCKCLQDFDFISNLSWFVGAIFYATSYYGLSTVQNYDVGNLIGAVGYFLGGTAYSFMTYSTNKNSLLEFMRLNDASKKIQRKLTRRIAGVHGDRETTLVNGILSRLTLVSNKGDHYEESMPPPPQTLMREDLTTKKRVTTFLEKDVSSPRVTSTNLDWIKQPQRNTRVTSFISEDVSIGMEARILELESELAKERLKSQELESELAKFLLQAYQAEQSSLEKEEDSDSDTDKKTILIIQEQEEIV